MILEIRTRYKERVESDEKSGWIRVVYIIGSESCSSTNRLPILQLNEFILRIFNPKKRTITHILGENHIDCWAQIENEYNLIQSKQSKLSKTQRDKVVERYNEILNL